MTYQFGEDSTHVVDLSAPGGLTDLHVIDKTLLLIMVDFKSLEELFELFFREIWVKTSRVEAEHDIVNRDNVLDASTLESSTTLTGLDEAVLGWLVGEALGNFIAILIFVIEEKANAFP